MKYIDSGQRSTPGRIQKLVANEAKPAPGAALLKAITRIKTLNAAKPKGRTAA